MTSTSALSLPAGTRTPRRVARRAPIRGFSRSFHVVGLTCIGGSVAQLVALASTAGATALWPAIAVLVPMSAAIVLLMRVARVAAAVGFQVIGALAVYVQTLTLAPAVDAETLAVATLLPKVALTVSALYGPGPITAAVFCTTGYVSSVAASGVATLQAGLDPRISPISTSAWLIAVLVLLLAAVAQRRRELIHPRLDRAASDEIVSTLRTRLESRAAAIMHDTVLSHLSSIALADDDRLSAPVIGRMREDLELLVSGRWLEEPDPDPVPADTGDWHVTPLYRAVRDARAAGLHVEVTGDGSAALRLDGDRARELGAAAAQCLVNVRQHAGTSDAEVAVYGSETELLVMVVDGGDGFDPEAQTGDRLGIRTSVRARVEAIGGTVQIWSTPGRGTSVLLRVPVDAVAGAAAADAPGGDATREVGP